MNTFVKYWIKDKSINKTKKADVVIHTFNSELWIQMQEITVSSRPIMSATRATGQSGLYTEILSQKNCAKKATSEDEIINLDFLIILSFLETGKCHAEELAK